MTEHEHQAELIRWCKLSASQYPDLLKIFAVPNGGLRNAIVAKKLKAEGVAAGIPDLILPVAKKGYYGLFIELKTEKGKLSLAQKNRIEQLTADGYLAVICYGWVEARVVLKNYLGNQSA
jgi:16S rRNA C1402 N4-methylase RsmH